jgi:hypothetical protein
VYYAQGNYTQADLSNHWPWLLLRKYLIPEHPDVATTLNNWDYSYGEQGNYSRLHFYQQALTIR